MGISLSFAALELTDELELLGAHGEAEVQVAPQAPRVALVGQRARGPGQDKSAKFPTSKAPSSAGFHSFRLIFGRAIISRNGLEAWMLFPERARAEHSR